MLAEHDGLLPARQDLRDQLNSLRAEEDISIKSKRSQLAILDDTIQLKRAEIGEFSGSEDAIFTTPGRKRDRPSLHGGASTPDLDNIVKKGRRR